MAARSSDSAEVQVRLLTRNLKLTTEPRTGTASAVPVPFWEIHKNIFKSWHIFRPPRNGRQRTTIHHKNTTNKHPFFKHHSGRPRRRLPCLPEDGEPGRRS